MTFTKNELIPLTNILAKLNNIPTWTKAKYKCWKELIECSENYNPIRFSGSINTYGPSSKGRYIFHKSTANSSLSKYSHKGDYLVICLGGGSFSNRNYIGIPVED